GIDYHDPDSHPVPAFEAYFSTYATHLRLRPGQQLHFELGRAIVAQCGSLIARCLYVKQGTAKQFVILDAGMTDLIRPALYDAHHRVENLTGHGGEQIYDIVGPICESSDVFAHDQHLPETRRGDLIAIRSTGAYGETMASQYNCRRLPKGYTTDELG
ncbi:MAG: diaminopimelate decarboxylase, partial [Bacteroidaceae bacterium]|nr:diaminopimelate decarboxylase [Bacteroidaceae bacterium]